jgi:hypothetical protein
MNSLRLLHSASRALETTWADNVKPHDFTDSIPVMKAATPRKASVIEPLESRIAPASIQFIDIDGITVTITSNKGSIADLQAVAILASEGSGQELRELRFSDLPNVFDGANISIVKGESDDAQFVNVGFINALGVDLGKVTVDGDLGRILAGDGNSKTASVTKLTLGSIGVQGLNTQEAGGSLDSRFVGRLGSLSVAGDIKEASLTALGIDPDPDPTVSTAIDGRGDIGNIFIGGNLIGGAGDRTAYIYAKGDIGNVEIVGSVLGGSGDFSATITTERKMGKVEIGGNLQGGLTSGVAISNFAGRIFAAQSMGSVTIGLSLIGGDGFESGNVSSGLGGLGNVTIRGDIVGGAGLRSGAVGTGGGIGKITVEGSLLGSTGEQSASILSAGDMKAVIVLGDIVGGTQLLSGVIASSGTVASARIEGSIKGGAGEQSGSIGSSKALGAVHVTVNIEGGAGKSSGQVASQTTIKSVHVGGSLLGGSNVQAGAIGSFGKLGPVTIDGDVIGGDGLNSATILSGTDITKVTVGGSIKGSGAGSGAVISAGDIQSVKVTGSIEGSDDADSGSISAEGKINKVTIGEDLKGGLGESSASIHATGDIGTVTISGSILGERGAYSASIIAGGNINKVNVTEDVQGGDGAFSALIESDGDLELGSGKIGSVVIGGSLTGGNGSNSAQIFSSNTLGTVDISGSVVGGQGLASATISSERNMGAVKIDGDLAGNPNEGIAAESGRVITFGQLKSLTIGGSLKGNNSYYGATVRDEGGAIDQPIGQVYAAESIGPIKITGNIEGGAGEFSAQIRGGSIKSVSVGGNVSSNASGSGSIVAEDGDIDTVSIDGDLTANAAAIPLQISASGELGSVTVNNLLGSTDGRGFITAGEKIGKVTVKNSSTYFRIMAGYDVDLLPFSSTAQISKVTIGTTGAGNFEATDIVAGVVVGEDQSFGTEDDTPIAPFSADALSRIASVVIKGQVVETGTSANFGIVAGKVSAVKVGGSSKSLTSGLDVIDISNTQTAEAVTIREIGFLG